MERRSHLIWWILVIVVVGTGAPVSASSVFDGSHRVKDVRFLIDGSGSMQVNDPDNRRGAALRLISGLIPAGSRSGAWIIDQQTTNIVPVAEVDIRWRKTMRDASEKLAATGSAADLEGAIRAVRNDWAAPDPRFDRHLVILFDGSLDIAGSSVENAESRERVLTEVLGGLADAQVTVHAIGLTNGVDHQLLRSLAVATNGRFEYVEKAALLERAFARILAHITVPNTIPPENNEIIVDGSVSELMLLAFRKSKVDQVTLVSSGGESIDINSVPSNITWWREVAYEMITVNRPSEGVWKIVTGVDPDNLVMADSSLGIEVKGLDNYMSSNSAPVIETRILSGGKPILERSLLETAVVTVVQLDSEEVRRQWTLYDDGANGDEKPGDGIFTLKLTKQLTPGEHNFTVTADAVSFRRVQHRQVSVQSVPVLATLSLDRLGTSPVYRVSVIPYYGVMLPESLNVTANLVNADGTKTSFGLEQVGKLLWQYTVSELTGSARQEIQLTVSGKTARRTDVNAKLEPLAFEGMRVLVAEASRAQPAESARKEKGVTPAPAKGMISEYVEFEDIGWVNVIWQVLLVNLLVGLATYGAYRLWRKKARGNDVVRNDTVTDGPATAIDNVAAESH